MAFLPALGVISTVLSVGATALSGISAYQQSKYQQQVAKNNSIIAARNAERASDAAQVEQLRSDREYAGLLGEQLAIQSASGFDILGHSQLQTRNNLRRVRGEAAKDIREKGNTLVEQLFQDSANYKTEAAFAKQQGINTLIGTAFQIGTTVSKSLVGSSKSTKKALV